MKKLRFDHDILVLVRQSCPDLFLALGALLLLLQHLLDDLLLLDEEGAHDAVAHAVAAPRATVGALDGLLGLGDLGVLAGSEGGDLETHVSLGSKQ